MSEYLIGYAGIPFEYFHGMVDAKQSFTEGNAEFYGFPMYQGQKVCTSDDIKRFVGYFARRLRESEHSVNKLGFALLFLVPSQDVADEIAAVVPSSLLPVPVIWNPIYGTNRELAEAKNQLIILLRNATRQAKRILSALRAEFSERANKTPLLLPLRNFDSPHLSATISALPGQLLLANDAGERVRQACREFEFWHPKALCQECHPPLNFYLDKKGVKFRAPGKALHGAAHPATSGHPDECVLAARRRMGAPFHHSFHYDCSRPPKPVINADLFQCHSVNRQGMIGHPHLNVAPNDYVR